MALSVVVKDREKQLFFGKCITVSSVNDVGEFDVLEKHANFITLIHKTLILDKSLKTEKVIPIVKGILIVSNNDVEVFVQS